MEKNVGKRYLLLIIIFISNLYPATAQQSISEITVIKGLIERIAPGKSRCFSLQLMRSKTKRDSFYLSGKKKMIYIKGTNALALAKGFNYYLQHYCYTSVSWYANDVILIPEKLPQVTRGVGEACRFQDRFFLNYCTFGYTMLWWKWNDWSRLVDWMALNGINMPLAITGQEYIWQKVWKQYGISEEQSRAFFTGPSHLPWQRMGNLDRWLGPLPQAYIDGQFELQKKILKREREFGMKPILPAFAGHVPYDLKLKHPTIKLTNLGSYQTGKINDAYFLDPLDPLFTKIQRSYLSEQQKLLGTNHIYGADPFNEMNPPSWEPEYLATVARTIYGGMKEIDPRAVWIQMGWTFYNDRSHWTNPRLKAMIKAVPDSKMIILEYFGEDTELWRTTAKFFDTPFIWCYLGNFGGNTQLAAPLLKIRQVLPEAEKDNRNGRMEGIGSTLEGFGVNDFIFNWIFDYAWNKDAVNAGNWITQYAYTRCGHKDEAVASAWKKLLPAVYDQMISGVGTGNMIQSQPMLNGTGPLSKLFKYDYRALSKAFPEFLKADGISKRNPHYQRDVAIIEKQILVNLAADFRDSVASAYYNKDSIKFNKYTGLFLSLCDDVDRLIGTQHELLLGDWIKRARTFGSTSTEKDYYEKDARVLITTWGGKGNSITDYAAKDWSGLIKSYYKKRWEMFFHQLAGSIKLGTEPDMVGFNNKRAEFDWDWANTNEHQQRFAAEPRGNTLPICEELYDKWKAFL